MIDVDLIRARFASLSGHLDERGRRLFAATEARAAGYGGIAAMFDATGIAPPQPFHVLKHAEPSAAPPSTIGRGLRELDGAEPLAPDWVRRAGGGRKTLVAQDPGLLAALLALVSPTERGDPMSPLRWTCLSLRHLADALVKQGHQVSHTVVGVLLKAEGFSLQANQKTLEGGGHPDRDAQFAHVEPRGSPDIARSTAAALAGGEPVIEPVTLGTRRRSWSARSRTLGASGARRARRSRCACTTSSSGSLGARCPMASTTWRPTQAGSVSA